MGRLTTCAKAVVAIRLFVAAVGLVGFVWLKILYPDAMVDDPAVHYAWPLQLLVDLGFCVLLLQMLVPSVLIAASVLWMRNEARWIVPLIDGVWFAIAAGTLREFSLGIFVVVGVALEVIVMLRLPVLLGERVRTV